jgi:tripartite ATP-independent transporter DctP family solute receptor
MNPTRRSVVALLVMALVSPGWADGAVILKFAHNNNPGHPIYEAAARFAELVESRTSGEVQIRVFPSAQLGRMNEAWTGVKIGSIEISGGTPFGTLADLVPELSLFDAPYVFRDLEHLRRTLGGPIGQELGKRLVNRSGVRILYAQYHGVRHLTTSRTPALRPDDLRGLKIRAVPTPIVMATLEGLGARPTPMDFAEVYQGLRSGVVDGQDNTISTIYTSKYFEVQKYLILTGHIHAIAAAVINERVYQSLTPSARAVIEQAAVEATRHGDEVATRQEAEFLGELKKRGMTVIGPEQGLDLEAFRARARSYVYPRFEAQWTRALLEQVQALGW